jgi:hypothetical protein
MTPEQIEYAMIRTIEIATTGAQMSASIALLLDQKRLLTDGQRGELAAQARHLGELFQSAGHDDHASDFGAVAAHLQRPRA